MNRDILLADFNSQPKDIYMQGNHHFGPSDPIWVSLLEVNFPFIFFPNGENYKTWNEILKNNSPKLVFRALAIYMALKQGYIVDIQYKKNDLHITLKNDWCGTPVFEATTLDGKRGVYPPPFPNCRLIMNKFSSNSIIMLCKGSKSIISVVNLFLNPDVRIVDVNTPKTSLGNK